MKFHGTKTNGKFVAPAPIAELARRHWESIKEGSEVVKDVYVPRNSRSEKQLGAIWGLMLSTVSIELSDMGYDTSIIYNLDQPTGIEIAKDDLCNFFYSACPIWRDGKRITLSKADTKEAAKFFEDIRNYASSQWGINVPDPNPNWKQGY